MFLAEKSGGTFDAPRGVRQVNGAPHGERRGVRAWWQLVYHFIQIAKSLLF